jgi:thiol-disulfide isomerase/thioredoxin
MKKILCLLSPILLAVPAWAQGIVFEEGNWQSVVAKAKAEHKLIYLDVYTTWCGPCKMLATRIFPQKEAGDKFNALFVNYRIDAEKGEGLDIAKKYQVSGYPTNLFIEPDKQTVVFRTMGASAEVAEFVAEGDKAMAEYKDPMTIEKYQDAYAKGKRDKAFLKAYLEKNDRLGRNNDEILNAYVAGLPKAGPTNEDLLLLAEMTKTANNKSIAVLSKNKTRLQELKASQPDYVKSKMERMVYDTYQEAVNTRNEKLLEVATAARKQYAPEMDERSIYWMYTQYYTQTGDEAKAFTAAVNEADFLASRSAGEYAEQDKASEAKTRQMIRAQLKMMKVDESQMDAMVEANMKNPQMRHPESLFVSNTLNEIAWKVYETRRTDKELVTKAIGWAQMAQMLCDDIPDNWAPVSDTYAHLLYASGQKDKAIALQQSVIGKVKAANGNAADYETALQKMQNGSL